MEKTVTKFQPAKGAIEIKIGRDRQSEAQKRYQADVERSLGVYIIVIVGEWMWTGFYIAFAIFVLTVLWYIFVDNHIEKKIKYLDERTKKLAAEKHLMPIRYHKA